MMASGWGRHAAELGSRPLSGHYRSKDWPVDAGMCCDSVGVKPFTGIGIWRLPDTGCDRLGWGLLDWGSRGRRFKSGQPDGEEPPVAVGVTGVRWLLARMLRRFRSYNRSYKRARSCIPDNAEPRSSTDILRARSGSNGLDRQTAEA